jgi:hypothetical protein
VTRVIGVALGWAMGHGLVSLTASLMNVDLSFVFPPPTSPSRSSGPSY